MSHEIENSHMSVSKQIPHEGNQNTQPPPAHQEVERAAHELNWSVADDYLPPNRSGLTPDPANEWYNLSFAEAGVEQFAGIEPLALFQQGWRSFS